MDPFEAMRLRYEIESALVDYWHDVDTNWGRNAHTWFVEDGVFRNSAARARTGRTAIREFYSGREGRGPRVARHVVTNLRVMPPQGDEVVSVYTMLIYAADGEAPLPSQPAILLADVTDVSRREADGRWRYVSRTIEGLFKGDTPTTT